jgi:hypothetical protein
MKELPENEQFRLETIQPDFLSAQHVPAIVTARLEF